MNPPPPVDAAGPRAAGPRDQLIPIRALLSPRDSWFAPVDASGLAFFRVAYGAIQLWEVVRFIEGRRLERYFLEAPFRFAYYGFGWVPMPPGDGVWWLFGVMAVCAAAVALGCFHRIAALGLFVTYTWSVLLEQSVYNNHYYLMATLAAMLALMPASACWSVDALWRRRVRSATVPAWCYGLLRFQLGVVYFYGGLAKLNPDWMFAAEPMGMFLRQAVAESGALPAWIASPTSAYIFAWGGLLLDLLIVPALMVRRTRGAAYAVAVAFHLMNAHLFTIGVFPWMMIPATTIYFAPAWPRRLGMRIRGARSISREPGEREHAIVDSDNESPPTAAASAAPRGITPARRLLVALIALHVLVQLLLPFRHWMIPGDVAWTEEGHRFSWRMKLRRKSTEAALVEARNPATGETSVTSGVTWLRPHQIGALTRPDMLIQLADHVAARYRERMRWRDVEVRVFVTVSLNGRPPRTIVDPTRDLVPLERSGWRTADISSPFPDGAPGSWPPANADARFSFSRRSRLNEASPD
jgi:hypothetical protein